MAIAIRANTNTGTTSQGSVTTASFTPAANSRLFVFAGAMRNDHTQARNWTISGGSLSWTLVAASSLVNFEDYPEYMAATPRSGMPTLAAARLP
jgi:hypothetical protein